jgi:drug/metabolite transporter (DMT)-like permease
VSSGDDPTPIKAPQSRDIIIGVGLMIVATLLFVCLDAIMKLLVIRYNVWMLAFVRNLTQLTFVAALTPIFGLKQVLQTSHQLIHVARGALLVATTVLITLALKYMPMAQTYAATFSAPLMAALIAHFVLGERTSIGQWACILGGFGGILIGLQPGAPGAGAYLILPLLMAAANACYHILTRFAGRFDGPLPMLFHVALWATIVSSLSLPFCFEILPASAFALLLVGGLFGTLAHLCLISAFRKAPTAVISPMINSQLIWAGLVGWIVFRETPTPQTLIGGAIVATSGAVLVGISGR